MHHDHSICCTYLKRMQRTLWQTEHVYWDVRGREERKGNRMTVQKKGNRLTAETCVAQMPVAMYSLILIDHFSYLKERMAIIM